MTVLKSFRVQQKDVRFHCSKWNSGWIGSVGHQHDESLDSQNDGGVLTERTWRSTLQCFLWEAELPSSSAHLWLTLKVSCSQAASLSTFPPHSCLDWCTGSFLFQLFSTPKLCHLFMLLFLSPPNCFILKKKKKNPSIHLFLSYLSPTELFPSAFF